MAFALPGVLIAQVSGLDTLDHRRQAQKQQVDTTGVRVVPWKFNQLPTTQMVSNDSLSRWELWTNWIGRKHRDKGVVTYRLGGVGRTDAMIHQTHEPKHQRLYWEEVSLNDPVSNSINYNFIPQFKISRMTERQEGINHVTRFNVRQYYLNKPLTKLNYTESKFNFRSLNFMLTQNLGRKTNYELSYWDRRDGNDLPRNDLQGLQIFSRVFHTIDDKRSVKASFLMNDIDLDESFGFQIPDLDQFSFVFENTQPNEFNANSSTSGKNVQFSYYERADTTKPHHFQATAAWNTRERNVNFEQDSVSYEIASFAGSARKWLNWGPWSANASVRFETFRDKENQRSTLNKSNWSLFESDFSSSLDLGKRFNIESKAAVKYRTDGEQGFDVSAKTVYDVTPKWRVTLDGAFGQNLPTIQEKYWQSNLIQGDENLDVEKIARVGGTVEYMPNDEIKTGVRGELKSIEDGIHLNQDDTFENMETYRARSITAFGEWNTDVYELSGSVTWHSYDADETNDFTQRLLRGKDRLFLRGGAYWKTYAFNRATFVKMGLFGIFSPNQYQAAEYRPVIDRWQNANDSQLIPSYYRVDLDVSARVRWIIFTLRFENILDNVGQLGYFETAQYPLDNRRFFFGIKVRFRN